MSTRSLIAVMSAGALIVGTGAYGAGCSPSSPAAPADAGKGDVTEPSDTGAPDSSTGSDAPAGQDATTDSASVDSSAGDAPTGADAPTEPDGGDSGAPTDAAGEADDPPGDAGIDAPIDSSTGDSSVDAAVDAPGEASLDAGIPDGACNALTAVGVPPSLQVTSTATVPAAVAGTIVDGTYYLVQTTLYEQDASTMATGNSVVWVISGGATRIDFAGAGADGGGITGSYDLYPVDAGDSFCTQSCIGVEVTCENGMTYALPGEWPYSAVTSDAGVEWSYVPNSNPLVWMTFRKQ